MAWSTLLSRLMTGLRMVALLMTVVASLLLHSRAGFSLPEPWPDEVAFVWPAKSLAEHATLLAPQLNGSRPMMWMPPGYTVVMAAVISLGSLDLSLFRWVSWFFTATAMLGLLLLHQRQKGTVFSLPLLVVTAIAPAWVVAGNIARMEALLICTSVFGFLLLSAGRLWKGVSILAAGVLIHPNGVFFGPHGLPVGDGSGGASVIPPQQRKIIAMRA